MTLLLGGVAAILLLFWSLSYWRERVLKPFHIAAKVNYIKITTLCLVWSLAAIAFMEPKGNGRYPPGATPPPQEAEVRRLAHTVLFLVDASASMSVRDSRNNKSQSTGSNIRHPHAPRWSGESHRPARQ